MKEQKQNLIFTLRRYAAPLLLFAIIIAGMSIFHHVLLPFFIAIFIAYIIEPIVQRFSKITLKSEKIPAKFRNRTLPRSFAVLSVYAIIFGIVASISAFFIPQFSKELKSLGDDVPRIVTEFREETLPGIEETLNQYIGRFEPNIFKSDIEEKTIEADNIINQALDEASLQAILATGLTEQERSMMSSSLENVVHYEHQTGNDVTVLRIRPTTDGGFDVLFDAEEFYIERIDEERFIVKLDAPEEEANTVEFNQAFEFLAESSGEATGHVLELGQHLALGVFEFIMSLFVTFMVAAFISIDAPGIIAAAKSLFPPEAQKGINHLLSMLNKGLSGVVRGQITIGVVNAILTTLGLALLKIKFALILGLIAGVFSLIPIFGTIIASVPAIILGLTQGLMKGFLVVLWILVIHFFEGNVLNPKIIGKNAEIHPALVIFALLAGEHTFGLAGALLAVPAVSILQTLFLFMRESVWSTPTKGSSNETTV